MKLLDSLRLAIKAPYLIVVGMRLWSRALDHFEKEQYRIALDQLERIERISGGKLSPRFSLLRAASFYGLDRYGEAEDLALDVKQRLKKKPFHGRKEERKYLVAYCSFLISAIHERTGKKATYDPRHEYASVSLEKVRSATKKIFPLRDHPGWRK